MSNLLNPFFIFPFLTQTPKIVSDMKSAVEWTRHNMRRFQGRVSFPKMMYMTEVEKPDALHMLRTTDDLEAKDPFLLIFTQQEDMEVFLQGCVDQQHLHVNAMFDGEL